MKGQLRLAYAGASLLVIACAGSTAAAQNAPGARAEADRESLAAEIIVTARRREESLQDVPQTVNAVSGAMLERLNLQKFEDVQAVVPGLTLSSGSNGYSTSATIRGASFQAESSATPTVEFYLNDALIQSVFLFQSTFDVGQIEVLRGPQGTLRGRASPSGSITVTTRRPDLQEIGGFVNMTGTHRGGINVNGGFNLPVISDVLAIRVAGIIDHNDYDHVTSINNRINPFAESTGGRASALFEPTDWLSASVMYQHLEKDVRSFSQVESLSIADPSAPTVAPVIRASDRLSINDGASLLHQKQDILTGQVDVRFAGQKLTYVGSHSKGDIKLVSPQDSANIFRNYEFYQDTHNFIKQTTHELRLASEERLFNIFDYTVGYFHSDFNTPTDLIQRSAVTLFGSLRTIANTPIERRGRSKEESFFGNLTAHIGDATELSGGVRRIDFKDSSALRVSGATLFSREIEHKPTVYNFSLSHRFSDDFLAYANTGSSWRNGPFLVGVFRPLTPRLQQFIDLKPEKSKSYEIGFKASVLEKRARLNVSAFKQDYDGLIYRGVPVYFVDLTATGERPNTANFLANVDSKIHGFDIDTALQVTPRWSVSTTFSYAKGKIKDQMIACTDINGDGIPDRNPGTPTVAQIKASAGGEAVAQCRTSGPTSFAPKWTLNAQSEYAAPVAGGVDGYVRGLLTYYPKNRQDPDNPYDNVTNYGLLNVYAGIRDTDGAWEVSLFAKNVTNTGVTLNRSNGVTTTGVQALQPPTFRTTIGQSIGSSYLTANYTAPREVGLNVRYAFGSR